MPPGTASWRLVVPVKPLRIAKSRLCGDLDAHRPDLALAFAVDTVGAALTCARVREVIVVTDDAEVAAALSGTGVIVVADVGAGLNGALAHGARVAAGRVPGAGVAALSADLPALRAAELDRVLDAAGAHERSFLADAAGIGTTLLAAAARVPLRPLFGGCSRERHAASGAVELSPHGVDSVRTDVDTAADLRQAVALGVGARTTALLPRLPAAC